MANLEAILTRLAEVQAILARLADGDPALIVPALAAAAVLLTVIGAGSLLAGHDRIALRLATGISDARRAAPATCRCRPRAASGSPLVPPRRRHDRNGP